MTEPRTSAQHDHDQQESDHRIFHADHLRALAILRRAEAQIWAHESAIAEHHEKIKRHEAEIASGEVPNDSSDDGAAHAAATGQHETLSTSHSEFMAAIEALGRCV